MPPKMTPQLWEALPPALQQEVERTKAALISSNRSAGRKRSIATNGLGLRPKPCAECGADFQPTGGRERLCGACKTPPKTHDPCAPWRDKIGEAVHSRWVAGEIHFKPKTCAACDIEFAPRSGAQRWCSDECRQRVRTVEGHGITLGAYKKMLALQDGCCAICGDRWRGWGTSNTLHIDHCHKTGRVRGLLCGDCNTALGRFGDDPVRLRAAAEYLEKRA